MRAIFKSRNALVVFGIVVASLEGAAGATQQAVAPQPQFSIEARIVQTSDDGARAIGVSWGASESADFTLGSIDGAALDGALSAMERSGQGRVLSTPRVTTPNNTEAEILQGVQVPIQTVANNTVPVTWRDSGLFLKVRPQVAPASTVDMGVVLGDGLRENASLRLRLVDGGTMVVGGTFGGRKLLVFITPRVIA